MTRTLSIVAAIVVAGGLAAGGLAYKRPAPAPQEVACLAVGPGVCLSGTEAWVAHAAALSQRPSAVMVAMAGDAF